MDTMIPAFPATVSTSTGGFGGSGDSWAIILILLLGLGGGGGLGGRNATSEVTGFQLGELSGKVATKDSISQLQNSTNQGFAGLNTAIMTSTSQIGNGIAALGTDLANRLFAISQIISDCCCKLGVQISEGFGQVRYDMAQFAAATNERIMAGNQRVLDALAADRAARQQDEINNLRLQQAMCGVIRYPNQITYGAGNWPPQGC